MLPLPAGREASVGVGARVYERVTRNEPSFTSLSKNTTSAMAAAVYFWARCIHALVYILKVPVIRTVSYFVGVGACFVLAYRVIQQ